MTVVKNSKCHSRLQRPRPPAQGWCGVMLGVGKVGEVRAGKSVSGTGRYLNPVLSLQGSCGFFEDPAPTPFSLLGIPHCGSQAHVIPLNILKPSTSVSGASGPHTDDSPAPAAVLQFSSVLTLSTRRRHWIPQVEGSVLQDCPAPLQTPAASPGYHLSF